MSAPSLTEDGRQVLRAGAVGAGVTVVATLVAGLLIGVVAATGSLGALRVASALLTGAPAAVGAFVGARRATRVLDHGLPAAAVGVTGAMVVVVAIGLLSLADPGTSVVYAIVTPVLGALVGAGLGGVRDASGTAR